VTFVRYGLLGTAASSERFRQARSRPPLTVGKGGGLNYNDALIALFDCNHETLSTLNRVEPRQFNRRQFNPRRA